MKSLVNKLSLFCLLATSAAPMHGNWLTNIGHSISSNVSSTFNRALWRAKALWQYDLLTERRWRSLCESEQLTILNTRIAAGRIATERIEKAAADFFYMYTPIHPKNDLLHNAVWNDNAEAAKILIKAGADVNAKLTSDFIHGSPLHKAADCGSPKVAKALINAGADVNAKSSFETTPLHRATLNRELVVAKILIDAGADVNAKDFFGTTPLHTAARYGGPQVTKLLIGAGANVNAKARNEKTPLHDAAQLCSFQSYNLLLRAGALQTKDKDGITPEDFLKKCTSKSNHYDIT